MAPAEWDRIVGLFHAAREKSGGERIMLLETACRDNVSLRRAIEELLKEDEAASGFLSEPLFIARSRERQGTHVVAGQRFGRYVTLALIGRGGMGEVWSAQDSDLDRIVALKFLSSEALADLDTTQIIREAKAASALNHPGIVTIHEVVPADSTMAIVMELVDGKPLSEMAEKPLALDKALAIGLQIAEALAAAHAGGIIHGDIKPENILVRRDQYVKVLDFGLARKISTETIASSGALVLGTLRYMSPEQARGEDLTPASDIFSFGLVLYELITARHAFPAASPLETAHAIVTRNPVPPSFVSRSIPARLEILLRGMLGKEPSSRPSAQEVARTLRELKERSQLRWAPRLKVWQWAAAAIVLLAVCFAVWRWHKTHAERNSFSFEQVSTLVPENRATAAAISFDGRLAAYANIDGVFVRRIENGETNALAAPPDYVVERLAWFADGTKLLASGFSTLTNAPSIWTISTSDRGAAPQLLREQGREASPSPNGARIVFLAPDRSQIWIMNADGKQALQLIAGPGDDIFPLVFWSPDGRRIAFQRRHYVAGKQRASHGVFDRFFERSYESVDVATRKVTAAVPGLGIASAAGLPDGRILFLRYSLPFTDAADELWEVRTDRATGAFKGAPYKVVSLAEPGERHVYGVSATADGKQVMVLKRSDVNNVFVGDFDEAVPRISDIRRLTFDERTTYPHAWTVDSRSVIFESDRNGTWDLFLQRIDQRTPRTLVATPLMEVLPHLTPDGRWVLYSAAEKLERGTYQLRRVPVSGDGISEAVPLAGQFEEVRCPIGGGKQCVLRSTVAEKYYVFYELDPLRGKGAELARTSWIPNLTEDWDVSPDGRQIAIPNHDSRTARIRIVNLAPGATRPGEHDLILPRLSDLRSVVWSASGRGWFVTYDLAVGSRMVYVSPDGSFRPLGDIAGWAVPSPDGRHVAFLNRIIATNAWLLRRH